MTWAASNQNDRRRLLIKRSGLEPSTRCQLDPAWTVGGSSAFGGSGRKRQTVHTAAGMRSSRISSELHSASALTWPVIDEPLLQFSGSWPWASHWSLSLSLCGLQ